MPAPAPINRIFTSVCVRGLGVGRIYDKTPLRDACDYGISLEEKRNRKDDQLAAAKAGEFSFNNFTNS